MASRGGGGRPPPWVNPNTLRGVTSNPLGVGGPGRSLMAKRDFRVDQARLRHEQQQAAEKAAKTALEGLTSLRQAAEIDYSGIQDMEQGNSISIYPKNQKKFAQEGVVQPGGGYLNPQTQENLTGKNASAGIISINREKGTGSLKIHPETTDVVGSPNKQGATVIRTNLFNKKAGWKWVTSPEGYENATSLISVENKGRHYYTLKTLFPNGVNLANYPNSKTEPRLRPTVQKGFVNLGDVVGKVLIRGKEHPVYNTISAFAHGGFVDKPLYDRARSYYG